VPNQRAVEANSTLPPLVLPHKYKLQAENSVVLPATSIPGCCCTFCNRAIPRSPERWELRRNRG
jgi:hypothetical protein